jgi:hypothetical protein
MIPDESLWECEVCSSIVRRNNIDGICYTCKRRTCINCMRVCERCKKIFCMDHVEVKEVWRQGKMNRVLLCDICSGVW